MALDSIDHADHWSAAQQRLAGSPAAPTPRRSTPSTAPSASTGPTSPTVTARAPERPLTPRQRAFVVAYAASANATQAAREAGYRGSEGALAVTGCRLLSLAKVRAALAELAAESEQAAIASRKERLEWLTKVVRGELTEEVATAKGVVRVSLRAKDRIRAAEVIAKMNGELVERRQHGLEPGEGGQGLAEALAGIAARRLGKG